MRNVVDIFAGCGGLSEGFKAKGFNVLASVEWEPICVETIDANSSDDHVSFLTDVREYENYLTGRGSLSSISRAKGIDGVIGGPPCQAYSLAGRIRCPDGMKDDYRNYLFEAYIEVLKKLKPKYFVFENVMGMLSAKPGGISVTDRLTEAFMKAGYVVPEIDKHIVFDLADMGGPQKRRRVIIFGVRKANFKDPQRIVESFYSSLKAKKKSPGNVGSAIGDLPALLPLRSPSGRESHKAVEGDLLHKPRFHNERDVRIFRRLAKDAQLKNPKLQSIDELKRIYTEETGKTSSVHKYYVLKSGEPSNLIPAHLYKDGLRHIHYDPKQARSITMREAARLQTFPDNFEFKGSQGDIYKMIGNAVPPLLAEKVAEAITETLLD